VLQQPTVAAAAAFGFLLHQLFFSLTLCPTHFLLLLVTAAYGSTHGSVPPYLTLDVHDSPKEIIEFLHFLIDLQDR
jgi:hypothetical protein